MSKLVLDYAEITSRKYSYLGKSNHFYVWLSWQFDGAIFLDAGTRDGSSAKALARNPKNLVLTYDVKKKRIGRIDSLTNAIFKELDVNLIEPTWLSKVDIILLDISHNGDDEQQFLDRIEPYFKGILVMDDIDYPKLFPKLYEYYNSLDREKHTLKPPVGCGTGTGVIPYGDWTIEVKE